MKKRLSFLMVSLMILGTSFLTSCGGSDGSNVPTAEDIQAAINNMAGYYTGSFETGFIENNLIVDRTDLPDLQWQADAEAIILRNFPLSALARGIQGNTELAEAVGSSTETKNVILKYYLCYSAFNEYAFTLAADEISFSVPQGDRSIAVKAEIYENPSYTWVQGDNNSQRIQMVITDMFANNMPVQFKPMAFYLSSKKKSSTGFDLF